MLFLNIFKKFFVVYFTLPTSHCLLSIVYLHIGWPTLSVYNNNSNDDLAQVEMTPWVMGDAATAPLVTPLRHRTRGPNRTTTAATIWTHTAAEGAELVLTGPQSTIETATDIDTPAPSPLETCRPARNILEATLVFLRAGGA